ncbi:MAG: N-acetyl-gamma-glutamyl-phosphate reductase [Pseudomonadota bacterium]
MSNKSKIKVGVVGATGYTGVELLRILVKHPHVTIQVVTSRAEAGLSIATLFPSLRGLIDLKFEDPKAANLTNCDLVFFATPNGIAMQEVPALLKAGVKVIDLAADFRLKDANVWEKWYNMPHSCSDLLKEAVYGLPEMNREKIKKASLVANPGCYPTAIQLGFIPLIVMAEASDNFKAYGVEGHRHLPEITQGLSSVANQAVYLTFVPHLTPMIRGIHATLYATLTKKIDIQALFESRYKNESFVDVMPKGSHPETRSVRGSNQCRISIHQPQGSHKVVILSVIDNLVKGAAGQAVQNMNLMFNFPEISGLDLVPLMP